MRTQPFHATLKLPYVYSISQNQFAKEETTNYYSNTYTTNQQPAIPSTSCLLSLDTRIHLCSANDFRPFGTGRWGRRAFPQFVWNFVRIINDRRRSSRVDRIIEIRRHQISSWCVDRLFFPPTSIYDKTNETKDDSNDETCAQDTDRYVDSAVTSRFRFL